MPNSYLDVQNVASKHVKSVAQHSTLFHAPIPFVFDQYGRGNVRGYTATPAIRATECHARHDGGIAGLGTPRPVRCYAPAASTA